jgi:hypothetical protein
MDKTVYIENVPSIELGGQTYEPSETSLISSFDTETVFDPNTNYIEFECIEKYNKDRDTTPFIPCYEK